MSRNFVKKNLNFLKSTLFVFSVQYFLFEKITIDIDVDSEQKSVLKCNHRRRLTGCISSQYTLRRPRGI